MPEKKVATSSGSLAAPHRLVFFLQTKALGALSMGSRNLPKNLKLSLSLSIGLVAATFIMGAAKLHAQNADSIRHQEQASRLYQRLTGVLPSRPALEEMTSLIAAGNVPGASFRAMEDLNFYKVTLYNMFSAYSNVTENSDTPLSDYTALVVGLIYNNQNFDRVLYGDILYTSNDATMTYNLSFNNPSDPANPTILPVNRAGAFFPLVRDAQPDLDFNRSIVGKVRPLFRLANPANGADIRYDDNVHFSDLQSLNDWPALLEERQQSLVYSHLRTDGQVSAEDISGILTTRQTASEFFNMGTNRRAFRFASKTFLCRDMEQLHDSSAPDLRVRQDVDRSPGGDSRAFQAKCSGCHSGMDAFAGAFSFFDFNDGRMTYNRNALNNPNNKQFRQANIFPDGYRLTNNSWMNFWNRGPNLALGWRTPQVGGSIESGVGARSLGALLASTEAFGNCMAEKTFKRICFRPPTPNESTELAALARQFENGWTSFSSENASNPYNMRALFAKVSDMCF